MTDWKMKGDTVMELIRMNESTVRARGFMIDDRGVIAEKPGYVPYPVWVEGDGIRVDLSHMDYDSIHDRATKGPLWYAVQIAHPNGRMLTLAAVCVSESDMPESSRVRVETPSPKTVEKPKWDWQRLT